MSILFKPYKIKNLKLKNRFVRSATYDAGADQYGHITDKQIRLFAELAEGGVGLIITGISFVHESGRISTCQTSIASDDVIPGLKKLVAAVHKRGTRIAVQLGHAGRESAKFLKNYHKLAIAPSIVRDDLYFSDEYLAMTKAEIRDIVEAFGEAAARAKKAGFDAVEVHGAHAHLLSQFLSPYTNRRNDNWGGTLEKRLRLHREVYHSIRDKVGNEYPVLIKIGVEDGFPEGLEFAEGKRAAEFLADLGFDALEISQGLRGKKFAGTEFRTRIDSLSQEAYFRDLCRKIRSRIGIPTIMVGGFRTFELMEEVVEKKETDLIALCRPFIREPNIICNWKEGDHHRATCISCNMCLQAIRKGEFLHCGQEDQNPE